MDECCVSFNQPRGKRVVVDTLDPDLIRFVDGHCQKLGTNGSSKFMSTLMYSITPPHFPHEHINRDVVLGFCNDRMSSSQNVNRTC